MWKIRLLLSSVMLVAVLGTAVAKEKCVKSKYKPLYEGLKFEMPVLEDLKFPNLVVDITKFGAVPDGVFDNTEAFKKAIELASSKGGGIVLVPKGLWMTGPIEFKSNINLHLEKGALILFSADKSKYKLLDTSFEGFDTRRCQSPISGKGLTNVAITGEGVIDGNGDAWRPVKREKLTEAQWKDFLAKGGVLSENGKTWYPSESYKKGVARSIDQNVPKASTDAEWNEIRDFLRPVMVSFVSCKNVQLDGVTFQNSPAWNLHPLMCENVLITNVTVRNPWYSANGDGLDLESCKNAIVYNSSFDVGDDAICVKSGKDEDGRKRAMPCENVIINKCVVYHGHGGFVVGSEMSGGVKNVDVSNCLFIGTDVGLRFKSTRGRGGVVENIYIRDINMTNIPTDPILFDLFYQGKSALEAMAEGKYETPKLEPVTEKTPAFRNIFIKDITCNGALRAMFFNGLPEMNVQNVVVENATIVSDFGALINETDGFVMKNVTIIPKQGPVVKMNNVKNITFENVFKGTQTPNALVVDGENSTNVKVNASDIDAKFIQAKEGVVTKIR